MSEKGPTRAGRTNPSKNPTEIGEADLAGARRGRLGLRGSRGALCARVSEPEQVKVRIVPLC